MKIDMTTDANKLAKRLKGRANYAEEQIKKIITKATFEVESTAKQGIQSGPKTGRIYTRRTVTHKASAAGEYPATDTGFLASNISSKVSLVELEGVVTSSAEYSKHLEFGTTNMQARPFMFPSLEKTKPKIRRMFKEAGIMKKVRN